MSEKRKRPLDLLSKSEFDSLENEEKTTAVLSTGKYLHWKKEGGFNLLLYQFNNFYVQMWIARSSNKVHRLESFSSDDGLMNFLNEVPVP